MINFTATFYVDTAGINITVPAYQVNSETFIKTDEYRPTPSIGHPNRAEWQQDTDFICSELGKLPMDKLEDFIKAFQKICLKHIHQYGRLIETDLFNYADETVLIVKSLVSLGGPPFRKEDGQNLWIDLRDSAFKTFSDHIWVNQLSDNPMEKTKLVKLSDYNPWK